MTEAQKALSDAIKKGADLALKVADQAVEIDALQGKLKMAAELIAEFAKHDSWRCAYYSECHCGLDDETDRLQLPRVPYPPAK